MSGMLSDYQILTVTFNTNGRRPCQPLDHLLGFGCDFYGLDNMPDLIAIGLQELSLLPLDPWTGAMSQILSAWDYVLMKRQRMRGLLLLLYCKRSLVSAIRDLQSVQTSVSSFFVSKGAVSISCKVAGVSLVVTCAHLSPHQDRCERRIRDYQTIIETQRFRNDGQADSILTHDYAIFMGDLNFRMNDVTAEAVLEKATAGAAAVREMLAKDQLTLCRVGEGSAFAEFREAEVTFLPTYKFFVSTCQYDLSRIPAYTDRILFRCIPEAYENELPPGLRLDLSPRSYDCHPHYRLSDHKPVSALFVFKGFNGSAYSTGRLSEGTRISFLPPTDWRNGGVNTVWFTPSTSSGDGGRGGSRLAADDFVALFHSDFTRLDEHIVRSYVTLPPETKSRPPALNLMSDHVPFSDWFSVTFTPGLRLQPSIYRLVYISSRRGDVLGLSPPFFVT